MRDVEEDTDILSLGVLEVLDFCWGVVRWIHAVCMQRNMSMTQKVLTL
jgi:hypothetical protein